MKAIGLINKLVDFYKPIDGEDVYTQYVLDEYLQQMQNIVSEIKQCTDIIINLNNQIVTKEDCDYCFQMVNFMEFTIEDEVFYNCVFKNEFIELKKKIKVGLNSLP